MRPSILLQLSALALCAPVFMVMARPSPADPGEGPSTPSEPPAPMPRPRPPVDLRGIPKPRQKVIWNRFYRYRREQEARFAITNPGLDPTAIPEFQSRLRAFLDRLAAEARQTPTRRIGVLQNEHAKAEANLERLRARRPGNEKALLDKAPRLERLRGHVRELEAEVARVREERSRAAAAAAAFARPALPSVSSPSSSSAPAANGLTPPADVAEGAEAASTSTPASAADAAAAAVNSRELQRRVEHLTRQLSRKRHNLASRERTEQFLRRRLEQLDSEIAEAEAEVQRLAHELDTEWARIPGAAREPKEGREAARQPGQSGSSGGRKRRTRTANQAGATGEEAAPSDERPQQQGGEPNQFSATTALPFGRRLNALPIPSAASSVRQPPLQVLGSGLQTKPGGLRATVRQIADAFPASLRHNLQMAGKVGAAPLALPISGLAPLAHH